jgi:DNA-binding response OmpR family regulator
MKVLVAEDDDRTRAGLLELLLAEGYSAVAARDGQEALDLYRRERPDVVLLDIMMPGASGYDVCREIRRENAHVPILFLSAKSEELDKVLGLELGADDFVVKPFGVREVVARIRAVTRRALCERLGGRPAPFTLGDLEVDPGRGPGPQPDLRRGVGLRLPAQQPHARPAHLEAAQAHRA